MAEHNALFARSAATEALVKLLVACPEGEVVTYAAMAQATNRDVQGKDRHLLGTALRAARRDHRAVFGTVIRVGIQRMQPADLAKEGRRRLRNINRAARRGGRLMDAGNGADMTADERLEHAAVRGVLAAVENQAGTLPAAQVRPTNADPIVKIIG